MLYEEAKPDKNIYNSNYEYCENHFYWEKEKIRPITYASHLESSIYSYYSFLLWKKYESFLINNELETSIIAYRKVPGVCWIWKNNIHFAMDAFENIINIWNCVIFAFDISWFFDNLDHNNLKNELINILWWTILENDWYKIFKNITKYSYINKKDINDNNLIENIWKYHKQIDINRFNKIKRDFDKLWKIIIKTNSEHKWIPQWTPISWMLANIYMSQFDIIIKKYIDTLNWKYYRYSDDILLIIPRDKNEDYLCCIKQISDFVLNIIHDKLKLNINNKKTEISIFEDWRILKNVIYDYKNEKFSYKIEKYIGWFQYLWFIFDWEKVLIRNKTLSNYYKKLIQNLKRLSHLKDKDKKTWSIKTNNDWTPRLKTWRILLGEFNRKYLYNWKIIWNKYVKNANKWVIDNKNKWYYLWFLSYWYNAHSIFNNFCIKYNVNNWIKWQLLGHRKIYNKFINKYWIK